MNRPVTYQDLLNFRTRLNTLQISARKAQQFLLAEQLEVMYTIYTQNVLLPALLSESVRP